MFFIICDFLDEFLEYFFSKLLSELIFRPAFMLSFSFSLWGLLVNDFKLDESLTFFSCVMPFTICVNLLSSLVLVK
jgi:hypothetical protein